MRIVSDLEKHLQAQVTGWYQWMHYCRANVFRGLPDFKCDLSEDARSSARSMECKIASFQKVCSLCRSVINH